MRTEFKLPDVGEGMSEGTLLAWRVEVGDEVAEGDPVAEVSTDKVDFDVPAPVAGTVAELPWSAGDVVGVGEVLMVIETTGDDAGVATTQAGSGDEAVPPPGTRSRPSQSVVASPVLRRLAAERGIDLATIRGTGPDGRIIEADLLHAVESETGPAKPQDGEEDSHVEPLTRVRAVAARRMAESARSAATSTTTFRVRGDAITEFLASARSASPDVKVTPLSIILRAVATVLPDHPRLNATIEKGGEAIRIHRRAHIAVAVATEGGLMVPVIHGIDRMTIPEIAERLSDLAQRARDGELSPTEAVGGTFTVSSTGGLEHADIVSTLPIINPPHTATMWVSRIAAQPRVDGDRLGVGPMFTASLSFDHRFVDGSDATYFINDVTRILESGGAAEFAES